MGAVSIGEAWPATGRPFMVAGLDRMPDDGRRYELVDGVLVVSPRPGNPHQEVAAVRGDEAFSAGQPFQIRVVPSQLVAGLGPA